MYSSDLALHYDKLISEHPIIKKLLRTIITENIPNGTMLLEIGCGTGSILQEFEKDFTVYGLDQSEAMLTYARTKVPTATLIHGDMRRFHLHTQFDVIVCVLDTINHLLRKSDWKLFFKCVQKHLAPGGVFIFDTNTIKRIEEYARSKPYAHKLDESTLVCARVIKNRSDCYRVQIQLFRGIDTDTVTYTEEIIPERSFPLEEIKTMVTDYFTVDKIIDIHGAVTDKDFGRVFFVCKPK